MSALIKYSKVTLQLLKGRRQIPESLDFSRKVRITCSYGSGDRAQLKVNKALKRTDQHMSQKTENERSNSATEDLVVREFWKEKKYFHLYRYV